MKINLDRSDDIHFIPGERSGIPVQVPKTTAVRWKRIRDKWRKAQKEMSEAWGSIPKIKKA